MLQSAFYILLVVSVTKAAPNPYLERFSGLGEWLSISSNSDTEPVEVRNEKVQDEESRRVVDGSDSNEHSPIKVVNPDKPIPIDDLLEQLNNEVEVSDNEQKKEMVGVLQQLRSAVYDNSIKRVNVLVKGFWHAVDLGLAGSSQRKRAAQKTEGILDSILNVFKAFRDWFYSFWSSPEEEDKNEGKDAKDKDKDKDKDKKDGDKDSNKDKQLKKDKKDGKESFDILDSDEDENGSKSPLKEGDSGDSHKKDGKDVVLKPLVKPEGKDGSHTSSNGHVIYDTTGNDQSLDKAMKSLTDLSALLGNRLKTREEVDKELKEAIERKDVKNKYYILANNSKNDREAEKDTREWTEADALKKLEEMGKQFDKTTDKTSVVADVKSFSMQPLYYVETYDKILDMIDRLRASGGDEHQLNLAEDYASEKKLFSLENWIQQTPRQQYQANRHAIHAEKSKKEKEKHANTRDWREQDAVTRLSEINKEFDQMADKEKGDKTAMVKDITSMAMQPFFHTDTYNQMFNTAEKLKKEGKVTEAELKTAENAMKRQARFALFDSILQKPEMDEHEKYKIRTNEAKQKREKLGDPRVFTEKEALEKIEDMNTNFASKDKPSMVKDVTNLSMQPLYHVETYDKISPLIEKLKAGGVAEADLKPAIESLAEESAFSSEHDIRQKLEGSLAKKLKNLKEQYLRPPLSIDQKKKLLDELQILEGQKEMNPTEAADAYALLKVLMKDSSGLDREKLGGLLKVMNNGKKNVSAESTSIVKTSGVLTSADLASQHVTGIDLKDFKPVKFENGSFVPA